ncbi:MAG: hypothetical protein HYS44_01045 [Candidatus Niyogibacteria bacterium]|nr:hypothetical protein [Candidatus Niyogibacteria bacterium]
MQKSDTITIPRKEYERLLKRQKIVPVVKLTPSERRALERGRRDFKAGKFITLEELERELESSHRKQR